MTGITRKYDLEMQLKACYAYISELEAELAKLKEIKELVEHLRGFRDEPVMQDEEWIPFTATEDSVCPVRTHVKVIVKRSNGEIDGPTRAGDWKWSIIDGSPGLTIVAYKVVA